jgi:hypothetical protein
MYTVATPRKHTLSKGESTKHLMCACILSEGWPGGGIAHPCWWEESFLRELSSARRTWSDGGGLWRKGCVCRSRLVGKSWMLKA